jgi:plasmid stability protein
MEAIGRNMMATLNIKNFPDELYERLQERAQREHRSLTQEVVHLLEKAAEAPKLHSIRELRGLGKELWEGIDPAEYVRSERDSWDS